MICISKLFCSPLFAAVSSRVNGDTEPLIVELAGWLRRASKRKTIPGGAIIAQEFNAFLADLPIILANQQLAPKDLTYSDDILLMAEWIAQKDEL
jgi:hypothetical protein